MDEKMSGIPRNGGFKWTNEEIEKEFRRFERNEEINVELRIRLKESKEEIDKLEKELLRGMGGVPTNNNNSQDFRESNYFQNKMQKLENENMKLLESNRKAKEFMREFEEIKIRNEKLKENLRKLETQKNGSAKNSFLFSLFLCNARQTKITRFFRILGFS